MSKAFTYDISNSISQEYQASPAWVITFVRWSNRDPLHFTSEDPLATRQPMVVINDCISVNVNTSKASHTPQAELILKAGDINYMASIAPSDFFFVNIVKSEKDAEILAKKASSGNQPINQIKDGFKGLFKVQSVRQTININKESGAKQVVFSIQGFAFTEFNHVLYFNPYLITEIEKKSDYLFVSHFGKVWTEFAAKNKGFPSVQTIVQVIINAAIGSGIKDTDKKISNPNLNVHFHIPSQIGAMLGVPRAKAVKDIIAKHFGIQHFSSGNSKDLKDGMQASKTFECKGSSYLKTEFWNQVSLWSIMQQYLNSPINEMFTCFRIQSNGLVMPTFIMRQMPFSTDGYNGSTSTSFLTVPRWKISVDQIESLNIGRDETARFNFVQVFGMIATDSPDRLISTQIAQKNYEIDIEDVKRNGLKPYIFSTPFDELSSTKKIGDKINAPIWANLMADALIGGQLKLNGSIITRGIFEPICIGDNLELDGIVYHIESVMHHADINPNGNKDFITSIQLSHGTDMNSTKTNLRYPNSDNPDMNKERQRDWSSEAILPGISDIQSIDRLQSSNQENTISPSNLGFNLKTKINKAIGKKKSKK